jgi:hypothetical protein
VSFPLFSLLPFKPIILTSHSLFTTFFYNFLKPFYSEFARAFDETVGRDGQLPITHVIDVLKRVFRGDVPAPEKKKVIAFFDSLGQENLSRITFLKAIESLRASEEATPMDTSVSAHYTSFQELHEHRLKAVRPEVGPEGIYSKSLTAFNEIGWRGYEQPVGYVRMPKKACEETKFLGELAKAGLI